MIRRLIRTDGAVQDFERPVALAEICRLIGASVTDHVGLRHLGWPLHVMIVDDLGYETQAIQDGNSTLLVPVKAKKPINAEATRLYHANCPPGTTHQIVGDVFLCPDEDFAA
jgi:hypothetical protein